jgi:hypothetical protein
MQPGVAVSRVSTALDMTHEAALDMTHEAALGMTHDMGHRNFAR